MPPVDMIISVRAVKHRFDLYGKDTAARNVLRKILNRFRAVFSYHLIRVNPRQRGKLADIHINCAVFPVVPVIVAIKEIRLPCVIRGVVGGQTHGILPVFILAVIEHHSAQAYFGDLLGNSVSDRKNKAWLTVPQARKNDSVVPYSFYAVNEIRLFKFGIDYLADAVDKTEFFVLKKHFGISVAVIIFDTQKIYRKIGFRSRANVIERVLYRFTFVIILKKALNKSQHASYLHTRLNQQFLNRRFVNIIIIRGQAIDRYGVFVFFANIRDMRRNVEALFRKKIVIHFLGCDQTFILAAFDRFICAKLRRYQSAVFDNRVRIRLPAKPVRMFIITVDYHAAVIAEKFRKPVAAEAAETAVAVKILGTVNETLLFTLSAVMSGINDLGNVIKIEVAERQYRFAF